LPADERGADEDHRHQPQPLVARRLPGILEADADRAGQIRQDEQRQRELERHQVRRQRNGHQRRAEAGDAEDQRAKERDRGEQRHLARIYQGLTAAFNAPIIRSRGVPAFIARRRDT